MHKKIAAFGEVMMRLQVPRYELLTQANELQYSFSGTGVNVTSALARFGHDGLLVTTLPRTRLGDAAATHLQKLGLTNDYISRSGDFIGMYFLENGFGARPSQVTYTDRLISSFNTAGDEQYHFTKIAKNIDIVHFCGITLAMNEQVRGQMKSFAKAVKSAGGTVVFDCNFRPSLWGEDGYESARPHYEDMLHLSDIVMMNEQDALFTLGMKTTAKSRREQLIDLIPLVAKTYDLQIVAGTHRTIHENNQHSLCGYMLKEGVFSFSEEITFSVLDRIGAGDAFTSGIIHGETMEFSPQKTVEFATTAGMLAHTIVGDTPMATQQDISEASATNIRDISR